MDVNRMIQKIQQALIGPTSRYLTFKVDELGESRLPVQITQLQCHHAYYRTADRAAVAAPSRAGPT